MKYCLIENCNKKHVGKGYCGMHYNRLQRYGTVNLPIKPKIKCKVENCEELAKVKGLCNCHYLRIYTNSKNPTGAKIIRHSGKCTIEGCNRSNGSNGYCKYHWGRIKREKAWNKIIDDKGGKCQICQNSYHFSCYDLHHRDPKLKNFTVGNFIGNLSYNKISEEVDKCDLICANCHRLLHYESYEIKTRKPINIGEDMATSKLKNENVLKIRELCKEKKKKIDIAKIFNVSNGTICNICKGKTWKHLL